MIVKKHMLSKDLRYFYLLGKLLCIPYRSRWGLKCVNRVLQRRKGKDVKGIDCSEIFIPGSIEVNEIRVRIYRPIGRQETLPAMLYFHGGGYISGIPEGFSDRIKRLISTRPCVVIAPDYRKAPEHPYPDGFNDCYKTLLWARDSCSELNISPKGFIIAGHSAGGGLAAAVTLKARDTKDVHIAFHMPIYPMIDDTQPNDPNRFIIAPVWDSRTNAFAWKCCLSGLMEQHIPIPTYAAPARNTDFVNLPPAISFVGDLDPFYRETAAYMDALGKAGVSTIFKVYKGCFHAFDMFSPYSEISKHAEEFTYSSYASFYDKYIVGKPQQ